MQSLLDSVTEVCRLCPTTTNLVHVFDKRIDDMREVVHVTTGVEILQRDFVSQKVCSKCCNITLKMFKFRQEAAVHDKMLKEKYKELLKESSFKIPNTSVTIKREHIIKPSTPSSSLSTTSSTLKKIDSRIISNKNPYQIHSSVADIIRSHPYVKLPQNFQQADLLPVVSLKMGEVEDYFKSRRLDMNRFICRSRPLVAKKSVSKSQSTHKQSIETATSRKRKFSDSSDQSVENHQPRMVVLDKSTGKLTLKLALPHTTIPKVEVTPSPVPKAACLDTSGNYLSIVGKSETLFTCNMCSAVENSAKALNQHKFTHMVCQFCKKRFRSLTAKTEHLENDCLLKKIMNTSDPEVALSKIDLILDIRKKYPDAFINFPDLPGMEKANNEETKLVICESDDEDRGPSNVIVLSDDDEPAGSNTSINNDTNKMVIGPSKKIEQPVNNSSSVIPVTKSTSSTSPNTEKNSYNPISIVKPDIRLKNNNLLNKVNESESDVEVMKNLIKLIREQKSINPCVDSMVQTDMLTNRDIILHKNTDMTCSFKNLKTQLRVYKIPVEVTNGPFNVKYNYNTVEEPAKELCYWEDLSVVDKAAGLESATKGVDSIADYTRISFPAPKKTYAGKRSIVSLSTSSDVTNTSSQVIGTSTQPNLSQVTSVVSLALPQPSAMVSSSTNSVTTSVQSVTKPTPVCTASTFSPVMNFFITSSGGTNTVARQSVSSSNVLSQKSHIITSIDLTDCNNSTPVFTSSPLPKPTNIPLGSGSSNYNSNVPISVVNSSYVPYTIDLTNSNSLTQVGTLPIIPIVTNYPFTSNGGNRHTASTSSVNNSNMSCHNIQTSKALTKSTNPTPPNLPNFTVFSVANSGRTTVPVSSPNSSNVNRLTVLNIGTSQNTSQTSIATGTTPNVIISKAVLQPFVSTVGTTPQIAVTKPILQPVLTAPLPAPQIRVKNVWELQ